MEDDDIVPPSVSSSSKSGGPPASSSTSSNTEELEARERKFGGYMETSFTLGLSQPSAATTVQTVGVTSGPSSLQSDLALPSGHQAMHRIVGRVGPYDVGRTIGRGNFAVVRLALHRLLHAQVAIKIMNKETIGDSQMLKVRREIAAIKALTHPHIVKLYHVMESTSKVFLVMEYASAGEIFEHVRMYKAFSETDAKEVFWQTLCAVDYCHKSGIVHRDLKAENLLLDRNYNIKVADFGFCNFFSPNEKLRTHCGSPQYAAPELFKGESYDGPKADIWSLGVILYVLVCGTFPFPGESLHEIRTRVLRGLVRIPFFLSRECEYVIRAILQVDPKKRATLKQVMSMTWMLQSPNLSYFQLLSTWPAVDVSKSNPTPKSPPLATSSSHAASVQPPVDRLHPSRSVDTDPVLLEALDRLHLPRNQLIESLKLRRFDHFYAAYHLLQDKLKRSPSSIPLLSHTAFSPGDPSSSPLLGSQPSLGADSGTDGRQMVGSLAVEGRRMASSVSGLCGSRDSGERGMRRSATVAGGWTESEMEQGPTDEELGGSCGGLTSPCIVVTSDTDCPCHSPMHIPASLDHLSSTPAEDFIRMEHDAALQHDIVEDFDDAEAGLSDDEAARNEEEVWKGEAGWYQQGVSHRRHTVNPVCGERSADGTTLWMGYPQLDTCLECASPSDPTEEHVTSPFFTQAKNPNVLVIPDPKANPFFSPFPRRASDGATLVPDVPGPPSSWVPPPSAPRGATSALYRLQRRHMRWEGRGGRLRCSHQPILANVPLPVTKDAHGNAPTPTCLPLHTAIPGFLSPPGRQGMSSGVSAVSPWLLTTNTYATSPATPHYNVPHHQYNEEAISMAGEQIDSSTRAAQRYQKRYSLPTGVLRHRRRSSASLLQTDRSICPWHLAGSAIDPSLCCMAGAQISMVQHTQGGGRRCSDIQRSQQHTSPNQRTSLDVHDLQLELHRLSCQYGCVSGLRHLSIADDPSASSHPSHSSQDYSWRSKEGCQCSEGVQPQTSLKGGRGSVSMTTCLSASTSHQTSRPSPPHQEGCSWSGSGLLPNSASFCSSTEGEWTTSSHVDRLHQHRSSTATTGTGVSSDMGYHSLSSPTTSHEPSLGLPSHMHRHSRHRKSEDLQSSECGQCHFSPSSRSLLRHPHPYLTTGPTGGPFLGTGTSCCPSNILPSNHPHRRLSTPGQTSSGDSGRCVSEHPHHRHRGSYCGGTQLSVSFAYCDLDTSEDLQAIERVNEKLRLQQIHQYVIHGTPSGAVLYPQINITDTQGHVILLETQEEELPLVEDDDKSTPSSPGAHPPSLRHQRPTQLVMTSSGEPSSPVPDPAAS